MEEMYASKKSIVRFIRTINQIPEGSCICHQTLTYPSEPTSDVAAKQTLHALLDTVGKSNPNMAVLYVMELNQMREIHFHILFVFFKDEHLPFAKEDMEKKFGRYVFKCWQRIQEGKANRAANQMRVHMKDYKTAKYLAKSIRPVLRIPKHGSRATRWWGFRRRALFNELGQIPNQQAALAEFRILFPRGVLRPYRKKRVLSLRLRTPYVPIERFMTSFSDARELDVA